MSTVLSSLFPIIVSHTTPHKSFKDAAIAAANKKKGYKNQQANNNNRQLELCVPPPHHSGDEDPSPYKKTRRCKGPPAKDYDSASTIDNDTELFLLTNSNHLTSKVKPVILPIQYLILDLNHLLLLNVIRLTSIHAKPSVDLF